MQIKGVWQLSHEGSPYYLWDEHLQMRCVPRPFILNTANNTTSKCKVWYHTLSTTCIFGLHLEKKIFGFITTHSTNMYKFNINCFLWLWWHISGKVMLQLYITKLMYCTLWVWRNQAWHCHCYEYEVKISHIKCTIYFICNWYQILVKRGEGNTNSPELLLLPLAISWPPPWISHIFHNDLLGGRTLFLQLD